MPERESVAWVAPAAAGGIVFLTILALVMPSYTDVHFDDEVVRWMLPVVLGIVGVSGLVMNRLVVLPSILKGEFSPGKTDLPPPSVAPRATYAQVESTALALASSFSVADAIYGIVAAVELDNSLWALPFGALGLVSLLVLVPYTRSRLEDLYRERAARGEA